MTIPIICLILSALMILVTKAPVALAQAKEGRGYDNRNPRAQQARLSGFGSRALAAHQNMIEAFPVFASGLLLALIAGVQGQWVGILSIAFVTARVAYSICYWADINVLRSLAWGIGFGASIGLMALPLF
ncbi:MAG TPA: MAPEG family protein [Wenzhouxiangellaceae bacterium]|nr:MAPEG family protein [Wenzhouxiangellaceae bacterium]